MTYCHISQPHEIVHMDKEMIAHINRKTLNQISTLPSHTHFIWGVLPTSVKKISAASPIQPANRNIKSSYGILQQMAVYKAIKKSAYSS